LASRLLTPEPSPTEPNSAHADCTISVPAAPPDAAHADCAISITDAAYASSDAVAVIRAAYTDRCDTIPVPAPTSVVAIRGPTVIFIVIS
jgi:hypothetical protein